MAQPIMKQGVRVFRPQEFKLFLAAIPKREFQTIIKTMLFTGMRYVELQRLQANPKWFDGDFIQLPKEAILKNEREQKDRSVRLTPRGKDILPFFLEVGRSLPSSDTMQDNMELWASKAGLLPVDCILTHRKKETTTWGLSVKSTRKTWESWLTFWYPDRITEITLSQGHTTITSVKHYLNMPFVTKDKEEMKDFVEGWI